MNKVEWKLTEVDRSLNEKISAFASEKEGQEAFQQGTERKHVKRSNLELVVTIEVASHSKA